MQIERMMLLNMKYLKILSTFSKKKNARKKLLTYLCN